MNKPTIRLFMHLARSGGTVMSACLGSMRGVVLLSEIHPRALERHNPLRQARDWFGLVTSADLAAGGVDYLDAIALTAERCAERGAALVIRDWTHLDFTGAPFVAAPTYKLTHLEVLGRRFRVVPAFSVRHPLDQWLSLSRLAIVQGKLELDGFLAGHRCFAEHAARHGFVRYEDFARRPDNTLAALCQGLEMDFDPSYRDRWADYRTITGYTTSTIAGGDTTPGLGKIIAAPPRPPAEPALLARLAANDDYRRALDVLGYRHPD